MGTAKDARGPFFRWHFAADLGDGLAYREAFTINAAEAVAAHLVNGCGLCLDGDAVPEPGKIVFVYRWGNVKSLLLGSAATAAPACATAKLSA